MAETTTPSQERTIVVSVDASAQAENAFNCKSLKANNIYVADYVKTLYLPNSEVILLHCPELSNVTARMSKGDKPPYEEWDKIWAEEKKHWKKLQDKFEQLIKDKQIEAKFEVAPTTNNKPGESIVRFATEKNATMIVMGTRGLGSIRRTVMGSVSDYVVHHANCPVIVCRPK